MMSVQRGVGVKKYPTFANILRTSYMEAPLAWIPDLLSLTFSLPRLLSNLHSLLPASSPASALAVPRLPILTDALPYYFAPRRSSLPPAVGLLVDLLLSISSLVRSQPGSLPYYFMQAGPIN